MQLLSKVLNPQYRRALRKYPWLEIIKKGDVAIDCGANVGLITAALAEAGAAVYAFEPNRHAFNVLQEKTAGYKKVTCYHQAVGTEQTTIKLFDHVRAGEDPVKWSTGSSVMATKSGIELESYEEVECIDLCAFIESLDRPVKLLKMDIEGAECDLLLKMIDTCVINKIGKVLVEMHEDRIPEIVEKAALLRQKVKEQNLTHVDLDWV